MSIEVQNVQQLREELDKLCVPPRDAKLEWLDQQILEVERLKHRFPHAIELHERSTHSTGNSNCFMYALGISHDNIYDWCLGSVFPNSIFMAHLIAQSILQSKGSDLNLSFDDDIVVYFDDQACQAPKHAGIKCGSKVISKWGSGYTHVWCHGLFEVPASYGDHLLLFAQPGPGAAEKAYIKWARSQGL